MVNEPSVFEPLKFCCIYCFSFTAYVQDNGYPVLYDMATIIINVTDINDNSPIFKESQISISIPENTVQDAIHTFVAHDADDGDNSRVRYTITGNYTFFFFFAEPQPLSCHILS